MNVGIKRILILITITFIVFEGFYWLYFKESDKTKESTSMLH